MWSRTVGRGLPDERLVAAFAIARVLTNRRADLPPRPDGTNELAICSGTQRDPSLNKELFGTGTSNVVGGSIGATSATSGTPLLMRLAIRSDSGVGGEPIIRPSLRMRIMLRDWLPRSPPPSRGMYERRDANSSLVKRSDGKAEPRAREEVEDVARFLELHRAIVRHLPRPCKPRFRKFVGVDEQRSPEAQGFPALVQRAAALAALNDYRGIRNQGHRSVPKDEVLWRCRISVIELSDREVTSHDYRLKLGVLGGIGLRDWSSQDRDRHSVGVNRRLVRHRIDSTSQAAHDDDPLPSEPAGKLRRDPPAFVRRGSGADDGNPRVRQWKSEPSSDKESRRRVLALDLVQWS